MKTTIDQESKFSIDEMFISMTDQHGIILSGNDVFVRVSGYSREQLVGQPHNIIRHPDVPKAVFKLLWDTIQKGEPIAAYVKNRNIDGKYYWVLASVIPTESGYLSIRIKPTSAIFDLIEPLYKSMLDAEKKGGAAGGIDAANKVLENALKAHHFKSYSEFYRTALNIEMTARQQWIQNSSESADGKALGKNMVSATSIFDEMIFLCKTSVRGFTQAMSDVSKFSKVGDFFEEKTKVIIHACERLEYLSLNMSVTANKFGKEGASLSTVASAFQRAAKEIAERFMGLGAHSQSVSDFVLNAWGDIQLSKLQIDMLSFFAQESANTLAIEGNLQSKFIGQKIMDAMVLVKTVKTFLEKSLFHQSEGLSILQQFGSITDSLKNVVMSLDLIRLGGRLEGARNAATEEAFSPYIIEMHRFISTVEAPIHDIANVAHELEDVFAQVHEELEKISSLTVKLDMLQYKNLEMSNS